MPKLIVALDFDLNPKDHQALVCEQVAKAFANVRPKLMTDVRFLEHLGPDSVVARHPTIYAQMLAAYERSQEVLAADLYARWCLYVAYFGVDSIEVATRKKEEHGGAFACLFVRRGGLLAQFLSYAQRVDGSQKEYRAPPELDEQLGRELYTAFKKIPAGAAGKDENRFYPKIRDAFLEGFTSYHKLPV